MWPVGTGRHRLGLAARLRIAVADSEMADDSLFGSMLYGPLAMTDDVRIPVLESWYGVSGPLVAALA